MDKPPRYLISNQQNQPKYCQQKAKGPIVGFPKKQLGVGRSNLFEYKPCQQQPLEPSFGDPSMNLVVLDSNRSSLDCKKQRQIIVSRVSHCKKGTHPRDWTPNSQNQHHRTLKSALSNTVNAASITKSQSKTGRDTERVKYETLSEGVAKPMDVLYASPMSILNQHEDNSLIQSKATSNSGYDYQSDDPTYRRQIISSHSLNTLRKPRTTVEDYKQYSRCLKNRGSPMPIQQSNIRRLEKSLESGKSSKYISKLMRGNSSVRPASHSKQNFYNTDSKVNQSHLRSNPKKFMSQLNSNEKSSFKPRFICSQRPFKLSPPHKPLPDSPSNFSPIAFKDQEIEPQRKMKQNLFGRKISVSIDSSCNLFLSKTQDKSTAIGQLDLQASVGQSGHPSLFKTIDQVNSVGSNIFGPQSHHGPIRPLDSPAAVNVEVSTPKSKLVRVSDKPVTRTVKFMISPKNHMHKKRPSTPSSQIFNFDKITDKSIENSQNIDQQSDTNKNEAAQRGKLKGKHIIKRLLDISTNDINRDEQSRFDPEAFNNILHLIDESPSAHSRSLRSDSHCSKKSSDSKFSSQNIESNTSEHSQETKQISNIMQMIHSNSYYDKQNRKEIAKMSKNFKSQKSKLCDIQSIKHISENNQSSLQQQFSDCSLFEKQLQAYKQSIHNMSKEPQDCSSEIKQISQQISDNPIFGKKFNYSLDSQIQSYKIFRCLVTISEDQSELQIFNLRPDAQLMDLHDSDIENCDSQPFKGQDKVCNRQDGGIRREQSIIEIIQSPISKNKNQHLDRIKQLQNDQHARSQVFRKQKSSASCKIADIQSIVFGGINSRFWLFRKHMNSMRAQSQDNIASHEDMPFYAWQCISIQLKDRTIDLVIESEREMTNLIKLLVFKLDILDGNAGSAIPMQVHLYQQEVKQLNQGCSKSQKIKDKTILDAEIMQRVKSIVYRKALLKFRILKIRSKISYLAFDKKMTISELILDQITKTYASFHEQNFEYPQQLINKFGLLMSGDLSSVFTRLIEFEQEHKKWMLSIHGHRADLFRALQETQKTLDAIKRRDKNIVKSKLQTEIKDLYGILEASGKVQRKQKKQEVIEIFQDTQVGGFNMYEQVSKNDAVKYRVKRSILERQLNKVNIILQMGNLKGTFYTRTCLKKIELVKQIFVLDIEQDQEVFIPNELNQKNFPIHFQFYDSLLNIIWTKMSSEKQQYFQLKTQFNIDLTMNQNWKLKLMNALGSQKMTHKHPVMSDPIYSKLDHTRSQHSKSLQKSNFVQIEHRQQAIANDLEFIIQQEHQKRIESGIVNSQDKSVENLFKNMPLIVRYCNNDEVDKKRQKFIQFKQTYLVKHHSIKNQGQKLRTLGALESYLEENIDQLYQFKDSIQHHAQFNGSKTKQSKLGKASQRASAKSVQEMGRGLQGLRQEQKEKEILVEKLMKIAQSLLDKKRQKQQVKFYEEVKDQCKPQVLYQEKNHFLNRQIEQAQQYFSNGHNLNNPNQVVNNIKKQVTFVKMRTTKGQAAHSESQKGTN